MKKILALLCLIYIQWFTLFGAKPKIKLSKSQQSFHEFTDHIDENNLKHVAEEQGYGYKYANLRELENLIKRVNKSVEDKEYKFAVPTFVGIPSDKIQKFLKDQAGFDLAERWNNLISKFFSSEESKQQALESKAFPNGFMNQREGLEHDIQKQFDQINNKINERTIMSIVKKLLQINNKLDDLFDINGADDLLKQMRQQKQRLMVRSTGKEDTKELANAGGNKSIPNVEPIIHQVIKAMRDVVSSYIGEKSITQRLGAGDKSLFDPIPFTPVLLQHMIGETEEKLPKCGVMFTEEAEGGISRMSPQETTGITVIQCAYGHNEGVVNSLIPVDTFYVDKNGNIYPVIRPKTYRMVPNPTKEQSLYMIENDKHIINVPALNKDAIECMKILAKELEQWYQGPMDVEFVIKEDEKTIYIVQARPIVHKTNLPPASYLLNVDQLNPEMVCKGQSIGVAGGSIRICTGKQIIITETIGAALAAYQKPGNVEVITCIVVGKMAPSTSHEATTFRSEGKPVVCIPDWQKVVEWSKKDNVMFVIDPQQALVMQWQGQEQSVKELIDNGHAMQGWCTYPVPRLISVNDQFIKQIKLDNELIETILPSEFNKQIFYELAAKTDLSMQSLLDRLKKAPEDDARLVLAMILHAVLQTCNRASTGFVLDEDYQRRIPLFEAYVAHIAQCILLTLAYQQTDVLLYSQRLFAIRFLEALIYQQPQPIDIVDGISAATLIGKELFGEQKIRKMLKDRGIELDDQSVQYLRIADVAFVTELEERWTDFVINLSTSDEITKKQFAQFIMKLAQFNVIPMWLNTQFAELYKSVEGMSNEMKKVFATSVAKTMIKEYASQADFINTLNKHKEKLNAFNINAFDDPKNFQTQWNSFQDELLKYFLSDEFAHQFKNANNLAKMIALGIITKFVDMFDLSIKTLKGSMQYELQDKLQKFHDMLVQYAELFKKLIVLVPKGEIRYNPNSPLTDYISIIERVLKKQLNPSDLTQTIGFNVNEYTIGLGAWLGAFKAPSTLEDVFSMAHQCILVALGALNMVSGGDKIGRPMLLALIEEQLQSIKGTQTWLKDTTCKQIGIGLNSSDMTLFFNYPAGEHSIQFDVIYNKPKKIVLLTTKFYGVDQDNRWKKIAYFFIALGALDKTHLHDIRLGDTYIQHVLLFNHEQKQNIESLGTYLSNMVSISSEDMSGFNEIKNEITSEKMDFIIHAIKKFFGGPNDRSVSALAYFMQIPVHLGERAIQEIADFFQQILTNPNLIKTAYSNDFFKAIVDNDTLINHDRILSIIKQHIDSAISSKSSKDMDLLKIFINNKKILAMIEQYIEKMILADDTDSFSVLLNTFKSILSHFNENVIGDMITFIRKLLENTDTEKRIIGLKFFTSLIGDRALIKRLKTQDSFIDFENSGLEVASQALQTSKDQIGKMSITLFHNLIEKDTLAYLDESLVTKIFDVIKNLFSTNIEQALRFANVIATNKENFIQNEQFRRKIGDLLETVLIFTQKSLLEKNYTWWKHCSFLIMNFIQYHLANLDLAQITGVMDFIEQLLKHQGDSVEDKKIREQGKSYLKIVLENNELMNREDVHMRTKAMQKMV